MAIVGGGEYIATKGLGVGARAILKGFVTGVVTALDEVNWCKLQLECET
jgi:hypothetical protein